MANTKPDASQIIYTATGGVTRTQADKNAEGVSVKDFGAIGDGTSHPLSERFATLAAAQAVYPHVTTLTDQIDWAAIQGALNHRGVSGGGTIFFPSGAYKVNRQIDILYPRINLRGVGRQGVYPGYFTARPEGISLVVGTTDHPGPNLFRFFSNELNALPGFSCADVGFTMGGTSTSTVVSCFGWDLGQFQYDFVFERISVHFFSVGFHLYKTGVLADQAAALRIRDSNINQNRYIALTTGANTTWNGFELTGCNAGQNVVGGVDIKCTDAVIQNNILEGQPNPIKLTGINSPFSIKNNYFELTSGFANINIVTSRGAGEIGPNYHYNNASLNVTHRVYLQDCAFINCIDPYWADRTYKCYPLPLAKDQHDIHGFGDNGAVYTSSARLIRVDMPSTVVGTTQRAAATLLARRTGRREINPFTSSVMTCLAFVSGGTTGTNAATASFSGVTANVGQWLTASFMVKYDAALVSAEAPYILWPAGVLDGSQDASLSYLHQVSNVGEFYVVTAAYRVATAFSGVTVQLNFYPYGTAAAASKTAAISGYTLQVVNTMADVVPFCDNRALTTAVAIPSTGTWVVGDAIMQATPAAAGFIGWVCTTAGTPGTWKTFGAISA